jgi:hypothetical protein
MKDNQLFDFLRETLNRLFTKSPKFFMIWQIISGLFVFISGLPLLLTQFNIHLQEPFATLSSKAVTFAAIGMLLMSKLTTQSKQVAVTEAGDVLKKTDDQKLPFTSGQEQRIVGNEGVNVVKVIPTKKN